MRALRQQIYLYGLNAVVRVAPALPDPVAARMGRSLGRLGAAVHPLRGLALEHLRRAFGSELDEATLRRLEIKLSGSNVQQAQQDILGCTIENMIQELKLSL